MEIININLENICQYEPAILALEKVFPEGMRATSERIRDILQRKRKIVKAALSQGKYVGNIFGFCLTEQDIIEFDAQTEMNSDLTTLYIYNLAVSPEYQGNGIGGKLINSLLETAETLGYTTAKGYFREGASFSLMEKIGGKPKKTYLIHGENYCFCELDLSTKKLI